MSESNFASPMNNFEYLSQTRIFQTVDDGNYFSDDVVIPELEPNSFLVQNVETPAIAVVKTPNKKRKVVEIDSSEDDTEQSNIAPNAAPNVWVFFFEKPVTSSILNRTNGLPFLNKDDIHLPLGMLTQSTKALARLQEYDADHCPSGKAKDGDIAIICWRNPNKNITPVFFVTVLKKQNKINKSLLIDHFFANLECELPKRFVKSGNDYYDSFHYTWMGIDRVKQFRKEDRSAFSLDEIFEFRGLSSTNKPFPKTTSFFLSGDTAEYVASLYVHSTDGDTSKPVPSLELETELVEEESEESGGEEQRFKRQKLEFSKALKHPSTSFDSQVQSDESWMINNLLELEAKRDHERDHLDNLNIIFALNTQQEQNELKLELEKRKLALEEKEIMQQDTLNIIFSLNAKQSQKGLELEKRKLALEEKEREVEREERELANEIENVQQQKLAIEKQHQQQQLAIQEQPDKCLRETNVKQRQEDLKFQLSLEKTRERAQFLQDLRHEIQTKDRTIEKLQLLIKQQETDQDAFKTRVASLFLKISEKLNHHRLVNKNLNIPFVSDEESDLETFLRVSPFDSELKESISNLFLDFVGKNSEQFKGCSDNIRLESNAKRQLMTETSSLIEDSQEEMIHL